MTRCWLDDPADRPTFTDTCVGIERIVDAAEHLPLPGQSPPGTPDGGAPGATSAGQPSPTYSNYTFDGDDDDVAPLYRNCVSERVPETVAALD